MNEAWGDNGDFNAIVAVEDKIVSPVRFKNSSYENLYD